MSMIRHIFVFGFCAVLLLGCTQQRFPDVTSSFSEETLNAPWPGFLPVNTIISNDLVDFDRSMAEIRTLEIRAANLRRRARLLKGPVLAIQERLRMQQAVKRRLP